MTYQIKQINNRSKRSVATVNQHPSPGGRDSRIIVADQNVAITDQIEIRKLEIIGVIPYGSAADNKILNVYTGKDNWFLWDNGKSALIGVKETTPNQNDTFFKGEGTSLLLTIDANGDITFGKAS